MLLSVSGESRVCWGALKEPTFSLWYIYNTGSLDRRNNIRATLRSVPFGVPLLHAARHGRGDLGGSGGGGTVRTALSGTGGVVERADPGGHGTTRGAVLAGVAGAKGGSFGGHGNFMALAGDVWVAGSMLDHVGAFPVETLAAPEQVQIRLGPKSARVSIFCYTRWLGVRFTGICD